MKTLTKNLCLALILLTVSNCGIIYYVNNDILEGNRHKVRKQGEDSFPENGKSIVSLNFRNNENRAAANSFWRRVNEDGTVSKRMKLTHNDPIRNGRRGSMIESGTYFLDGIDFAQGNGTKNGFDVIKINANTRKQNGWDFTKKQPLWFSFTVAPKEELTIPDIIIAGYCKAYDRDRRGCGEDNFVVTMKFDTHFRYNVASKSYKIGYKVEQKQ